MPIAALFIIVTSWNELKCPTIKERIKKKVVINSYNRLLPSNKEKQTTYTNVTVCNNNSDESQNYYAEGSKIVH